MGWTPHAITEEAIEPIKEYCTNRHFKCKGCRYSIKYIIPQYDGLMCCVFANCPCDWEVPKEDVTTVTMEQTPTRGVKVEW